MVRQVSCFIGGGFLVLNSLALLAEGVADVGSDNEEVVENSSATMPKVLSLASALALQQASHPALLQADAAVQRARNQQSLIQADKAWHAELLLDARRAERADRNIDSPFGDSRAELSVSKLLWDFGESGALSQSTQGGVEAAEQWRDYQVRINRVMVIEQFLNVLVKDYQFAADDEAMTIAFLPYTHAQEEKERYDSISELEVLEKHSHYLDLLALRNASQQAQRHARLRLALALGLPNSKPLDLIEPDLSAYDRPVPVYEELFEQMLSSSPIIQHKQAQLAASQAQSSMLEGKPRPKLSLNLHAGEYEQVTSSKDAYRAALQLRIPLLSSGVRRNEQVNAAATLSEHQAQLGLLKYELQEQCLLWVQRLTALNERIEYNQVSIEYRERALDKSRLLYEMEADVQIGQVQTDMAQMLATDAKHRFERALIWEQIDALLNQPAVEFILP